MPIVKRNFTGAPSFMSRQHMARDAAEAKHLDRIDAGNIIKRRVRAAGMALSSVRDAASREWDRQNSPIPAPRAFGGREMHPSRVRILSQLVAELGWSDDPREACEPMPSLDDLAGEEMTRALAELAEAEADAAAYEANRAGLSIEEFQDRQRRKVLESEQKAAAI